MCRELTVYATTDDGQPHPSAPEALVFESPNDWTPETPTCTCWIGDEEGDGAVLRHTFVERYLRKFLKEVSWGNIVIEVR